jgi:nitrate reductase gamma subunit
MRIRSLLQRSRRWLATTLVVLGLGGAVVVHHGMPEGMPMDHGHTEHVMATCLGVIAAAATIVGATFLIVRRRRRRRPQTLLSLRLADALASAPPMVRARAGPPVLLFLRLGVLRR